MNELIKPQFTNRIDLGHLLQAGVLIAIGGAIGSIYLSLQPQITAQAKDIASLSTASQRQDASITQLRQDQSHLSDTIGATLTALGNQLSDLRVLVAAKEGAHGR
jgi:cell division protein FtsB